MTARSRTAAPHLCVISLAVIQDDHNRLLSTFEPSELKYFVRFVQEALPISAFSLAGTDQSARH
jgi:hypothetical protein